MIAKLVSIGLYLNKSWLSNAYIIVKILGIKPVKTIGTPVSQKILRPSKVKFCSEASLLEKRLRFLYHIGWCNCNISFFKSSSNDIVWVNNTSSDCEVYIQWNFQQLFYKIAIQSKFQLQLREILVYFSNLA